MEVSRLAELSLAASGDEPIQALGAAAELRREVERVESVLVRRARARGMSWAAIALAMGVSRQAVHQKYGGRRLLRRDS
jgi:hypothetical protein